jgi:hypothetical protein
MPGTRSRQFIDLPRKSHDKPYIRKKFIQSIEAEIEREITDTCHSIQTRREKVNRMVDIENSRATSALIFPGTFAKLQP